MYKSKEEFTYLKSSTGRFELISNDFFPFPFLTLISWMIAIYFFKQNQRVGIKGIYVFNILWRSKMSVIQTPIYAPADQSFSTVNS